MSRQTLSCILTVLVILIVLTGVTPAQADVAPPEPPSGTNPLPGEELTHVRMAAETVLIDIGRDGAYGEGLATVTASFTMRNLGNVDEQMEVRFPLDQTTGWGGLCKDPFPQFWPIEDLKVRVNGRSVATQKTYETITLMTMEEPFPTVTLPCWEHFPVSFPAGQDVTIEVTYTAEPYHHGDGSYVYAYVLETGTGWKDTIGSADIIFQLPYELNSDNLYGCRPAGCAVSGQRVQWHLQDFEPSANISISLLPPPLWQAITLERANVTKNPNDGEAWGRLAKAYKESLFEKRGLRSGPQDMERYRSSVEAYQNAIRLLPGDADWHYGFAELLCMNAEWNDFPAASEEEAWQDCVEQLRATLELDPKHERANELLQYAAELGLVDLSGPQPDYLILTPKPTATAAPPTEMKAPAAADTIRESTKTAERMPATQPGLLAVGTRAAPTAAAPVTEAPRPASSKLPFYIGAAALTAGIILGIARRRGR